MDAITIEDEDGFRTEWPWPEGKTMLGNASFVDLCVTQHDVARTTAGLSPVEEG